MIHRPHTADALIGRTEVVSKLYEAWNDLTRLENKTLRIFKEDWGMDRFREDLIDRVKKRIPEMKELIENVINLYKKDIKELEKFGFK